MRLTSRSLLRAFTVLAASLLACAAQARMEPMADSELSEVTGQAFINLQTHTTGGVDFTKINLGMDVQTQLNIKKLELGNYTRTGEPGRNADIAINNFALGTVDPTTGAVSPFNITDPYVELAYSSGRIVGMRVGFGEAKGWLSGDIKTLTGNVAIDIYGTGNYLGDKIKDAQWTCFLNINCALADSLKLLAGNEQFKASAQLTCGPGMTNCTAGTADPVRAQYAGIPNGGALSIPNISGIGGTIVSWLLPLITSQGCSMLNSVPTCFNLANYQSLPIGTLDNTGNTFSAGNKGFFISMQTEAVKWQNQQYPNDPNKVIETLAGAFMNLPRNADETAALTLSFQQAFDGITRKPTCFGTATAGC